VCMRVYVRSVRMHVRACVCVCACGCGVYVCAVCVYMCTAVRVRRVRCCWVAYMMIGDDLCL